MRPFLDALAARAEQVVAKMSKHLSNFTTAFSLRVKGNFVTDTFQPIQPMC